MALCATSESLLAKPDVTAKAEVWSDYFGPSGQNYLDHPVITGDIKVDFANGVFLGVWQSFGLDDSDLSSNAGDETDYTIGLAKPVATSLVDDLTATVAFGYYDVGDPLKFQDDILYFNGRLDKGIGEVWGWETSTYVAGEFYTFTGDNGDGGWDLYLGVNCSRDILGSNVSIDTSVVFDDGTFGFDPYIAGLGWLQVSHEIFWGIEVGGNVRVIIGGPETDGALGIFARKTF